MSEGITFSEMIEVCLSEANRIEIIQRDLVESGLRSSPDADQLRRMRVFERMTYVFDLCRTDRFISGRLRELVAAAKAAEQKSRKQITASSAARGG